MSKHTTISCFYKVAHEDGFRRARSESVGVQKAAGAPSGGVKHTQTQYAVTVGSGSTLNGGDIPLINQAGPSTSGGVDTNENNNIIYSGYKASGSQFGNNKDSAWERITIQKGNSYCIAEANYLQNNSLTLQSQTVGLPYQVFHVTSASGEFSGSTVVLVEYDNHDPNASPEEQQQGIKTEPEQWNQSPGRVPKYRRVTAIKGNL